MKKNEQKRSFFCQFLANKMVISHENDLMKISKQHEYNVPYVVQSSWWIVLSEMIYQVQKKIIHEK